MGARSPFLLVADHAGRVIPRVLGNLGLPEPELERHIAWDIGVERLGAHLARTLGAPLIAQAYSRLVIDCNRAPGSAQSIPLVSDGTLIPGNHDIPNWQRRVRAAEIYAPYQAAIGAELARRLSDGQTSVLVALHSFTPVLGDAPRPWRYGVLHRDDSPFSTAMLALLSAHLGGGVGDNQPYAMDATDNTVPLHSGQAVDYLELEVRQDILADDAGQRAVAGLVAGCLLGAHRSIFG